MTTRRALAATLLGMSLLFLAPTALPWDNDYTHPWMTEAAIDFLAVDPVYNELLQYGYYSGRTPPLQCGSIDEGSVKEDLNSLTMWDTQVWGSEYCTSGDRPLNHFYNPKSLQGLAGSASAPTWAWPIWEQALAAYNGISPDRNLAYFRLGQVCHLLEDMSSPAHVTLDKHLGGDDIESYGKSAFSKESYFPAQIRTPLTHGLPGFTRNTFPNFFNNLAWRTYYGTTYQAVLTRDLDAEQPDSELYRMFPDLSYAYSLKDGHYWGIGAIGEFHETTLAAEDEWWKVEDAPGTPDKAGPGYFHIENVDPGNGAGPGVVPAVTRIDFFSRPTINATSAELDAALVNNWWQSFLDLDAANLWQETTEWVAGLIQFFEQQTFRVLNAGSSSVIYAGRAGTPRKIVLHVSKPAAGLTNSAFTVMIGTANCRIVSVLEGTNEYVLELIAPAQAANGTYDLRVSVATPSGALVDLREDSILYADSYNVDVVAILDRSGSMGYSGYMEPAKQAASLFVDLTRDGDQLGIVSFSDAASIDFPLSRLADSGFVVFSDQVENGIGSWTPSGSWAITDSLFRSPIHAWTDSPGGTYPPNSDTCLVSPVINLASFSNPHLLFWHVYDTEPYFDFARVEGSSDGGNSWTDLAWFDGSSSGWQAADVDLAGFAGHEDVHLRFCVQSDSFLDFDGWTIDDVQVVQAGTRDQAKAAIGSIESSGNTSVGDGLAKAQDELDSKGMAGRPHAAVLLSDGYENESPMVSEVLPRIVSAGTKVHTIALGPSSDEQLLLDVAARSGGTYHLAPLAGDLAAIYNTIAGALTGLQTVLKTSRTIALGQSTAIDVVIDSTVSEATFFITWTDPARVLSLVLETPQRTTIDPQTAAESPDIDYASGAAFCYYRVRGPALSAGTWRMGVSWGGGSIAAASLQWEEEPFSAVATADTVLTVTPWIRPDAPVATQPIQMTLSISDTEPILGANVVVRVTAPVAFLTQEAPPPAADDESAKWGEPVHQPPVAGNSRPVLLTELTLYDDGLHDDGAAQDGIYGTTFSDTGQPGTYAFTFQAAGNTTLGVPFTREAEAVRFVADNPEPCFAITTNTDPPDSGTVDLSPAPNCGDGYLAGTDVTLTAMPSLGYDFAGWTGALSSLQNPLTVTMSSSLDLTANFESCVLIDVEVVPLSAGSVLREPEPNCEDGQDYRAGTPVVLTAAPNSGYEFVGWSGDVESSTNPIQVQASPLSIVASFANCTVAPQPPALVYPAGGATVRENPMLLDWEPVLCAGTYDISVRKNNKKQKTVVSAPGLTGTSYQTPRLKPGKRYKWSVSACNAHGCTASPWRTFTMAKK